MSMAIFSLRTTCIKRPKNIFQWEKRECIKTMKNDTLPLEVGI